MEERPVNVIYTLSNAQKKSLLIQGQPIILLLPVPPIEIDDPVDWAKSVLPSEFRPMVLTAEEEEVLIEPKARRSTTAAHLTELLGAVAGEGSRAWLVTMVVMRTTLAPTNQRHSPRPAQWPANVTIDGKPLLGE